MSRWVLALMLAGGLTSIRGQEQPKPPVQQEPQKTPEDDIPEEDANLKPREYSFNPLQANKEMQVGNEYFKKRSYKAAAMRFREATHWNANLAGAWLRLGEAEEKRRNPKEAKEAYAKYLELKPDAHEASEIRKKIAHLGP